MKSHVWRPLWVVVGMVALILAFRYFYVPSDFGVGERGFMYGYHRAGNQQEWENLEVKFRTIDYCRDCHPDKVENVLSSKHRKIPCETCHNPAYKHPEDPPKLPIDRSRELCYRCHVYLPYPTSGRSKLPGIDKEEHNPGMECALCHNPHRPDLEAFK